jgi:hypothetical protein
MVVQQSDKEVVCLFGDSVSEEEVMVKRYTMKRSGSKRTVKLWSDDGEKFFTKPDSDGRTSEWWRTPNERKKGAVRYSLMGTMQAPNWLKKLFGGKK